MQKVFGGGNVILEPSADNVTPAQNLAMVDDLLNRTSFALEFPTRLENLFQSEISDGRVKNFVKLSLIGLVVYDLFLITDYLMMPDIIKFILIVQLAIATPALLVLLYAIHRRILAADIGIVLCQLLILGTIILFYIKSHSIHAGLLIFTVPISMAFGNVVLPLPFRLSLIFTLISIGSSVLAVTVRQGGDIITTAFVILTHTTIGIFMMFSTYRGEKSERKTYLFNLRERFRADVLAEKNERLRKLSEVDGLTGVYNRRYFDEALDRLWQAGIQAAEPLALFLVDIDHFKKLNDTFGHQEGDRYLKAAAQCLQAHLMPNTVLARYGGEEFVVLLPGVNEHYARSCAEVLRSAIGRLDLTANDGSPVAVTVSIGTAAMIPNAAQGSASLVSAADQALYRAKANGRNRVEGATFQVQDTIEISIAPPSPIPGRSTSRGAFPSA